MAMRLVRKASRSWQADDCRRSEGRPTTGPVPEMDKTARIVVERPMRAWYRGDRDTRGSYWIEIGGRRVGKVRRGERLVTPIAAGRNIVRARINWTGSRQVHVYLYTSGVVVLRVRPAGSTLDIGQVFGKNKYLTLRVAVD